MFKKLSERCRRVYCGTTAQLQPVTLDSSSFCKICEKKNYVKKEKLLDYRSRRTSPFLNCLDLPCFGFVGLVSVSDERHPDFLLISTMLFNKVSLTDNAGRQSQSSGWEPLTVEQIVPEQLQLVVTLKILETIYRTVVTSCFFLLLELGFN